MRQLPPDIRDILALIYKQGGSMNQNKTHILTMLIILSFLLHGEPWKSSLNANLTLTQHVYSDNWTGSETGSVSWIANTHVLTEKQLTDNMYNKNELRLAFGQTYNQNAETNEWSDAMISTDLIDLESILRLTMNAFVDPYASGRMESKFLDESDTSRVRWINPILFTESVGAAKVFVKDETCELATRIGFAMRQHIDRAVLDTLTGERATHTANDAGLVLYGDFTHPVFKQHLTYVGKLSVYKALFFSESNELEGLPNGNHWQYPDINWENTLNAHVIDFVIVSLYVQLLYDREIASKMRFKETLALGLTITLP